MTKSVGTTFYAAPEVFDEDDYTRKVDLFSFGVILYEIVTGQKAFKRTLGQGQYIKCVGAGRMPRIPDYVPRFVKELITSCWAVNPDVRPWFHQVFEKLQANNFKVFPVVDPEVVKTYLREVIGLPVS
jgi:serine/threonine-protein kinase CTR1